MSKLTDREEIVLKTIIEEFVKTGEPVGSRFVSKSGPLNLSAASIRNVMSDLEDKGLIAQPHTSSGRMPSDSGYRYYIDKLVTFESLDDSDIVTLSESLNLSQNSVIDVFKGLSRRMGDLTGSVGFLVAPKINTLHLKHVEFLRLSGTAVIAIIVTKSGMVHNMMLELDPSFKEADLREVSNYMNMHFRDKSLVELKSHVIREMKRDKDSVGEIVEKVFNLGRQVFSRDIFGEEVIFEGTSNMLNMPEFKDVDKVREIYRLFEEKKTICEILDDCMSKSGVQIFVGSEIGKENINELGLVSKSYSRGGNVLGALGIIGPKRMQYSHAVGVVDFSSRLISGILENLSEEDK